MALHCLTQGAVAYCESADKISNPDLKYKYMRKTRMINIEKINKIPSGRIFLLGDSKTGINLAHRILKRTGINSVSYYFNESGVNEYKEKDGSYQDYIIKNWPRMKEYIEKSGNRAFSDYPTRIFYKQLMENYKDDFFILTKRKNINKWQISMLSFMKKHNLNIDIKTISDNYLSVNSEIREMAKELNVNFCEIDIDQDISKISKKISSFFSLRKRPTTKHENLSPPYNMRLWSERVCLFDAKEGDPLSYVEEYCQPNKGTLSESGWVFLVNDSSGFLQYFYGRKNWTFKEKNRASFVLKKRRKILENNGILYRKYVIPEKTSVYENYMPRILSNLVASETRPALLIQKENFQFYSYLADILKDVRSYGHVYFKGDSHPNWLGAYFIYHHIVETMNADINDKHPTKIPIKLSDLLPNITEYKGDIAVQIPDSQKRILSTNWGDVYYEDLFEHTIRYDLPKHLCLAKKIKVDNFYREIIKNRDTLKFKITNSKFPRAVIFRDSTSDNLIHLLAQHFSSSLFVWHEGLLYKDIIEKEKPDIVLHIQAERFFVQYKEYPVFSELFKKSN